MSAGLVDADARRRTAVALPPRPGTAGRLAVRAESVVTAVLWLTLGAVVVWRTALLAQQGGPVGVDMGNWLRLFRTLPGLRTGGGIDVDDVIVPPVGPLLAGLTSLVVGPLRASWFVPALASTLPGVGVWLVTRRVAPPAVALAAALAITLVHPTATAFAWGGVPQLVGLGLAPVAVAATVHATWAPSRRAWLRAGGAAAAVALTSTLVTSLLVVALTIAVVVALAERGRAAVAGIGWAVLAGSPAAALYVPILTRMVLYEGRVTRVPGEQALRTTVGEPVLLWSVLIAAAVLAPLLLPAGRRRALTIALSGAGVAGLWLDDVRFAALLPLAVVVAVALLAGHALDRRSAAAGGARGGGAAARQGAARTVATLAGAVLIIIAAVGMRGQEGQVDFYAQLVPPGVLADAQLIATMDRGGNAVAVVPLAGAPTGWWLEAVGVDALVASRPDWLAFPEERDRAAEAVALFTAASWPTPTTAAEACELGAGWLYVPRVWQGLDARALARELSTGRLVEVVRTPTAVVLRAAGC